MPFIPPQNLVPQITMATGQNLDSDVGQAVQKFNQDYQQRSANAGLLAGLQQNPNFKIDPKTLASFNSMPTAGQSALLGQTIANFHDQYQQQQSQTRNALMTVQMAKALQDFTQNNAIFPAKSRKLNADADAAEHAGATYFDPTSGKPTGVYDANGRIQLFPVSKNDEPAKVDPLIDPTTGKPVPGRGIVRLTGQDIDTSGGGGAIPQLQLDPTGKYYWNGKHWMATPAQHATNPIQAAIAQQISGGAMPAGALPTPMPAPDPATASPQPAPAPNATPSGPPAAAAGAPASGPPPQFQPGTVKTQNGHTYQFNGTTWDVIQ